MPTAHVSLLGWCNTARKYGASTFQLAVVNEATIDESCDNLVPDTTICLGQTGYDCTKVYTVVANEWVGFHARLVHG